MEQGKDRSSHQMHHVYVIGHRQPDTDSICSVIGYAEFLNHGEPGKYIPARCGEMNEETQFVLSCCRTEQPVSVESVEASVEDLPYLDSRSVQEDIPAIDIARMMDANDMRNMPVVDSKGMLRGLVSEYGLARAYVQQKVDPLSLAPVSLDTLARILNARVLVGKQVTLEGRVYTVIDALPVALSRLTTRDIVIVGDNEPAQLVLISAGIAALIIADGAPVGDRVIAAARERVMSILSTPLDAFGTGKMISLSLPGRMIMETEIPTVLLTDSLEAAKHVISSSKYRTACVVEAGGIFLGQISRSALMQDIHKSVILLDHNEVSQAVEGIENAEILEIIDHHRLGAITTLKPVKFLNNPVGATSTIITHKFMDVGVPPAPPTACLLLAGILSDTLGLRMSTTTAEDRAAVQYLAGVAGIDPSRYGNELIRKGMNLSSIPLEELLTRDIKRYSLFGWDLIIAQVMVPSYEFNQTQEEEIDKTLRHLRERFHVDLYIVMFTNVVEEESEVYLAGEDALLSRLELHDRPLRRPGVMSRKKDYLPQLGQMLRTLD
ncbi:MAG: putative manganese-dependent inorganic diphosphatase [Methanomicrobiales archaeon]|nr:putative manganese-dependent inorganic diphosphatase [Methanomicrobiales archaeon]